MTPLLAAIAIASGAVVAEPQVPRRGVTGDRPDGRSLPRASASYETVVIAERDPGSVLAAQRRLDRRNPGFVTAIDVTSSAVGASPDDTARALGRAPGLTVRSLGGLGQFSSVSIRGSTSRQVAVFFEGQPIASDLGGFTDVSSLPLQGLEVIEVYRGYIPVRFGGQAVGGAINLRLKRHDGPASVQGSVGGGGLGARALTLTAGVSPGEKNSFAATVAYGGADGNFSYFDRAGGGRLSVPRGDSERVNNHYDRGVGLLSWRRRDGDWKGGAHLLVLHKPQGIPGPGYPQDPWDRLTTTRANALTFVERNNVLGVGSEVRILAGVAVERQHFVERGSARRIVTKDESTVRTDGSVRAHLRAPLWAGAFVCVAADVRHEWTGVDDGLRLSTDGPTAGFASRQRLAVGGGVELEQRLWQSRFLIVPALRLDRVDSRHRLAPGAVKIEDSGRDIVDTAWSPRLGARLRLLPWLQLRASGGSYFRPPTVFELFGDRGFIKGNEGLRPERGMTADGGLVIDTGEAYGVSVYAQVAAFSRWSRDLIQWIPVGPVQRPDNLAKAFMGGLEAGVQIGALQRRLQLRGNYTLLHSRSGGGQGSTRGRPLPGRPKHELAGELSVGETLALLGGQVALRISYNFELVSGTYLDSSGRIEAPRRNLHGVGLLVEPVRWLRLAFHVQNIFDERVTTRSNSVFDLPPVDVAVSDYIGYPLPGRTVWLMITGRFTAAVAAPPRPQPQPQPQPVSQAQNT